MSGLIDPPRAFGPLFAIERARLLDKLQALAPSDWKRPTPCPGWTVLGLEPTSSATT